MSTYDFTKIEQKWRKYWLVNKTFKTTEDTDKEFYYVLDMFPYPSGAGLHVGHPAGYTATDVLARYKLMKGFNVLHPIGWDAFGLPAEQYAIKTGNHPSKFTKKNINTFRSQLQLLGFSYDWDKEVNTTDPEFIKWTQWIFQQLYKKGLAELREIPVNWCEKLSTVLANDEIEEDENGNKVSQRGGYLVTQKPMIQWVLKITKYVDKLLDGLEKIDWLESTKKMQKNWIKDFETGEILIKDWLFSRQRYWGEPFPIKNINGRIVLIPENELPLILPKLDHFQGKEGKPALANSKEWIKSAYDLNTMPGSAGSSWYFLAYILKDEKSYISINSAQAKEKLNKWMPVDLYVGGTEHIVGHLLYSRFWNIFLSEIGILDIKEPFQKLIHQGMILGSDGKKMSKSKGNSIQPDDIIKKYGADSLRAYIMFMGAFEDRKPWSDYGVKSIFKWLNRVWKVITQTEIKEEVSAELKKEYARLINSVTNNIEEYKFNMAISSMMVFINRVVKEKSLTIGMAKGFIQVLNPFCPHITEEMWEIFGFKTRLSKEPWPDIDRSLLIENEVKIIIQQNGKFKGTIELPLNSTQEDIILMINNDRKFSKLNSDVKKIIFVPNKLINIVK